MAIMHRIAGDLHRQRGWPAPAGSAQQSGSLRHGQDRRLRARHGAQITHAPRSPRRQQRTNLRPSDRQEAVMNPIRHSHLIRRAVGLLASLTALLAQVTTGPAASAAQLRPDPPGWLERLPVGLRFPPAPAGWDKHPPLPGQAQVHRALADGMAGWQITLIVGAATVLAALLAVTASRIRAGRRRIPATTGEAVTTSGAVP
jgi:hypothetical protein